MARPERLAAALLGLALALPALAAGGHLKLLAGHVDGQGVAAWDLRLQGGLARGPWEGRAALQSLGLRQRGPAPVPLPDDARRAMDLSRTAEDGDWRRVTRVDRLWLGRAGPRWRWRLGRQAISWGQGLAYNPVDVFAPFPPAAIDTEYKPGEDAFHLQGLLPDGTDLQALVVSHGAAPASVALKLHRPARRPARPDLDLLLARHYRDGLAALGLAQPLGGAMARLDVLHWRLHRGGGAWEAVVNVDYAPGLGERSLYLFAEYYRNGLPGAVLVERLARGERFFLGRDYGAAGLDFQPHPLHRLRLTGLVRIGRDAWLLPATWTWDWREDWQWEAGVILSHAPAGGEFDWPAWVYGRLKVYF